MESIIVLATGNKNKLKEMRDLLKDFPVEIKSLADFGPMPEPVEDGATFDENAYKKAVITSYSIHYTKLYDLEHNTHRGRPHPKDPAVTADHITHPHRLDEFHTLHRHSGCTRAGDLLGSYNFV